MDIANLRDCLASAVRYVQDHALSIEAAPYFDEIPENFIVPSIYFPVPRTETRKASLSSWRTDIFMECWFAAATDWQAFGYAEAVRDSILADGCAIDIVAADGTATGAKVRVTEPAIRKQEDRIVRLAFTIRNYHSWEGGDQTASEYYFASHVKQDDVYEAWLEATEEQREEEEVQEECLQEVLENLTAQGQ